MISAHERGIFFLKFFNKIASNVKYFISIELESMFVNIQFMRRNKNVSNEIELWLTDQFW